MNTYKTYFYFTDKGILKGRRVDYIKPRVYNISPEYNLFFDYSKLSNITISSSRIRNDFRKYIGRPHMTIKTACYQTNFGEIIPEHLISSNIYNIYPLFELFLKVQIIICTFYSTDDCMVDHSKHIIEHYFK